MERRANEPESLIVENAHPSADRSRLAVPIVILGIVGAIYVFVSG